MEEMLIAFRLNKDTVTVKFINKSPKVKGSWFTGHDEQLILKINITTHDTSAKI